MMFLDTLMQHCRNQPDKLAIQFIGGRPVTYRDLELAVNRSADYLLSLGIQPGDRIAVQLPKCLPFVYFHLAALQIGAIFLPLNPAYPLPEMRYFLADSGARLLIAESAKESAIASIRPDLPALEPPIFIDPDVELGSVGRGILGDTRSRFAKRPRPDRDDALHQRHDQPPQRRGNHPRQSDRQY